MKNTLFAPAFSGVPGGSYYNLSVYCLVIVLAELRKTVAIAILASFNRFRKIVCRKFFIVAGPFKGFERDLDVRKTF